MCDCAEQLEKERRSPTRRSPVRRTPGRLSPRSSDSGWGWNWGWVWGWDWGWIWGSWGNWGNWGWLRNGKNWFPILGGATLLALIAFLYKSMGKIKNNTKKTVWKKDSCATIPIKKQPIKPEKFKPCTCED